MERKYTSKLILVNDLLQARKTYASRKMENHLVILNAD